MIPTYVSIDMDFWDQPTAAYDALRAFLRRVPKESVLAVMNHHQLLPHVNTSEAEQLVNIDYHADLTSVDPSEAPVDCGSWVSYVKWRNKGAYRWVCRDIRDGSCTGFGQSWDKNITWKRHSTTVCDDTGAAILRRFPIKSIVRVGLALSPMYTSKYVQPVFYALIKEFDLQYKKGRRYYG